MAKVTKKSIKARIALFSTNRTALQVLGHEIAMEILNHAAPAEAGPNAQGTGDCSLMLLLAAEMPKSWQEQLRVWCMEFSPVRFSVNNGKCEYSKEYKALTKKEDKVAAWNLEGAAETPFYELSKEPDVKKDLDIEDLVKMVEQLANRIDKQVSDGKVKDEAATYASALANKVRAIRVEIGTPVANDTGKAKDGAGAAKEAA